MSTCSAGQEPVTSFDQLNTRLRIGDSVRVIDTQRREFKGRAGAPPAHVSLAPVITPRTKGVCVAIAF